MPSYLRHRLAHCRQYLRFTAPAYYNLNDCLNVGEVLSTEFSRFINAQGIEDPLQYRRPSPMIAPSKAVESVIRALQMNNYPEQDAGVLAAYNFSKPHDCENGQVCG